jgi:hypothetical protein
MLLPQRGHLGLSQGHQATGTKQCNLPSGRGCFSINTQRNQRFRSFQQTMKIEIDLKSALCGIAIALLAVFAIGAGTLSNEVGRYRIATVASANYAPVVVLVDTATGKVWTANPNRKNDGDFFEPKQGK